MGRSFPSVIHGMLIIDKPLGRTSMDMIREIRKRAGRIKAGHAGTLDPLATGVLVCCLGKATKQVEVLMDSGKEYRTTIDLSAFTTTDDSEGERTELTVTAPPDLAAVEAACAAHTGEIQQTPPVYSAVKIQGQPAYKRTRKGETVTIAPKTVRIDGLVIESYQWPHLRLRITCGRGTYIRSLARQLGEYLGTGGTLLDLRRTRVGPYDEGQAISPADLPDPLGQEHLLPIPEMGEEGR